MKIVCWPFLILALFLSACAPGSKDEQTSVTTTYSPPTPTVSQEGKYTVVHGATDVKDMVTQYDAVKKGLILRGKINVRPVDGANPFVVEVDLEGQSDRDGFIVMKPGASQPALPPEVKMGVKATCLGKNNECTSSFIDIYIQYREKVYHHQVESHETPAYQVPTKELETEKQKQEEPEKKSAAPTTTKPATPSTPVATPDTKKPVAKPEVKPEVKPEAKPTQPAPKSEEKPKAAPKEPAKDKPEAKTEVKKTEPKKTPELPDGEDEADEGEEDDANGRYVGDIQGDIEKILDSQSESGTKVHARSNMDQVIGPVTKGRLERATNLLTYEITHRPTGFHIVNPQRERYYGSIELVYLIAKMGEFTKKLIPDYTLPIGDLSKKNGGKLGSHSSHQNGLDADIAFYFRDAKIQGNLFSALQAGKAKPVVSWMPEEQWKLLKHAVSTKYVDRIFIHQTLKTALCQIAIKNGEIKEGQKDGDAYELLRRLRPEKNHYNHFHLRVKCSKTQVRCRQMADPAPGTGCF